MSSSTNIKNHKPLSARETLRVLSERLPEMKRQFDVGELAIFSSVARDEARTDSDLDVLVMFAGTPTFDNFMGLKLYLEDVFGTSVDLGTKDSLRDEIRPYVEPEMIEVSRLAGVHQRHSSLVRNDAPLHGRNEQEPIPRR